MSEKYKIKFSEKVGYGFGDMSSSMFWKIFSYYLPFFYSNIFGLSLAHAGTLILVTKLYDAISDPVMGLIADRTHTRWGKYRPYLLWIAIPFAVVGVLTFFTPQTDNYTFKHIYAYVTYILMMTVYTAINVPYGAMLGVVTDDSREKSVFSSFRMFFAYIGSFIAMGTFEPLLRLRSHVLGIPVENWTLGDSTPIDWTIALCIMGAVCAVLFILTFAMTREHVTEEEMAKGKMAKAVAADGAAEKEDGGAVMKEDGHDVGSVAGKIDVGEAVRSESVKGDAKKQASVWDDLKNLLSNKPWWLLLGGGIAILLFNCVRGGAAAYYFSDVLGVDAVYSLALFLTAGEIAALVGVVITVPVSEAIGKKGTFMAVLAAVTVLSVLVAFLPKTAFGMWALLASHILISLVLGINSPLLWSMFADVADYSELKNSNASTGLIFSSSSMAQKFGAAFGSAIVLWVLMAFGYDNAKGAVQTEEALATIRALISWIPAIGSLAGLAIMAFYPLTDKKMKEVRTQLEQRRADN